MKVTFKNALFVHLFLCLWILNSAAEMPEPTIKPLVRAVELNVGESAKVVLHDGSTVEVKLLDLREERDPLRDALRRATVKVEVNGKTIELISSAYNLPKTIAGVRIDCPAVKGLLKKSSKQNAWGLAKDARLRLWPAGSPLLATGTFAYPVRQKWFANDTQMANIPTFVDGGDMPGKKNVYYHYGLDFGGAEGHGRGRLLRRWVWSFPPETKF